MRYSSFSLRATLAACTLSAFAMPALAQTAATEGVTPAAIAKQQRAEVAKGTPKRWDRAPGSEQARLNIQKQEIAAAYAEARTACQKMSSAERSQCLKDARQAYQDDLRNAKTLVAASPTSEVEERVSPIEGSGVSSPQMGGSGAGATGSGSGQTTQSNEEDRDDTRRREDEPLPEDRE